MEKLSINKEAEQKESKTSSVQSSFSNNLDSDIIEVFQETEKSSSDNVFVVERVVNGSVHTIKSSRPSCSSETEDTPNKHTSVPVSSGESSGNVQAAKSGIQIVKEIAVDHSEEPEICDDLEVIAEISATEESSEQDSVLKSKKGPLPGLLPLEQNSSASNSPEVHVPNKGAMRSTEKLKTTDLATNSNSQPKGKKDVGKEKCSDTNGVRLCDSIQDHIVIEPDIEIHTLSDEFQMEFEDSEISPIMNSLSNVVATTPIDQIEKLARETLACWSCRISLYDRTDALLWESMEFCSEKCLKTYMKVIGSHCNMCNAQVGDNILGKLCVRFGTVIRQFCTADCLEKFKGSHKLCATCQVNMSNKEKTHCSPVCEELSLRLANKAYFYGRRFCSVCNELKEIQEEVYLGGRSHWLCSKPCLNAFRFSNKVTTLTCETCSRGFDINSTPRFVSRNANKGLLTHHVTLGWFCSNVCFAIHLIRKRKIELCARCQVKKYNVDMIRKPTGDTVFGKTVQDKSQLEAQMIFFCSLYCFTHYPIPISREPVRRKANETAPPAAPSVAPTVVSLQSPIVESPLSTQSRSLVQHTTLSNPVSVLAPMPPRSLTLCNLPAVSTQVTPSIVSNTTTTASSATGSQPPANATMLPIELQHKIVLVPPKPVEMKNKSVWCRPSSLSQSEQTKTMKEQVELPKIAGCDASTSTDEERKPLYIPIPIPIPVPIYVPVPMAMYNFPSPFPVAFPMPVVTPFIFPVGSNLLDEMIKAMGEAKKKETDEETISVQENHSPVPEKTTEASDGRELTDVPTSPNPVGSQDLAADEHVDADPTISAEEVNFELEIPSCSISSFRNGSRKRSHSTSHSSLPATKRIKDIDCSRSSSDSEESTKTSRSDSPSLHLKGGFLKEAGVRAWKNWAKRNENKRLVDCKFSEMSVVDMNTSLIAFVQQIRKPDGDRYRPDILLYLISGLQESLAFGADFRRQNLLMDAALLPFQIELDKHLQPFYDALLKGINSGSTMEVMTCLKESHLWKCRQLGVDSPIVLVFTMLYFNTKYFRLYTAEQHLQMSFANVQKVPKKTFPSSSVGGISNGSSTGKNAAKVFSLQFDDTKTQQEATVAGTMENVRRKKPLDMPQNVDYLPHCPVKIYNFYVSKCPEDAKTRKDLFYLLPDPSCAPESPVWYSSQPVPREILARMLRRVLLVEEVLHNLCSLD
ncbi:hypothetical protein GHT06_016112 [Daphnia sinensis]|uniref:TRASH domain-containing protein n=1 Tax=Daphnia sinensis TaxID=1820382 RepID=A0AAD5LKC0_9CRUS|nr:hypothetical protein GHT06_016112 [Daphnia sinensis]